MDFMHPYTGHNLNKKTTSRKFLRIFYQIKNSDGRKPAHGFG